MAKDQATAPKAVTLEDALSVIQRLEAKLDEQAAEQAAMKAKLNAINDVTSPIAAANAATEAEMAEFRKWVGLSAEEKTQQAADRRWAGKGKSRFRCFLNDPTPDKGRVTDFPMVVILADSEDEARERYRIICGINSTDKQIVCASAA